MNDILPPKRPLRQPPLGSSVDAAPSTQSAPIEKPTLSVAPEELALPPEDNKRTLLKKITTLIGGILAILALLLLAGFVWYMQTTGPVSTDKNAASIAVTIVEGASPTQIGDILASKKIIRSSLAFNLYNRLNGTTNSLQAGTYRLSPADSTGSIVDHLVAGKVDGFTLTFYPGATLTDTSSKDASKKVDVTSILKRAGYSSKDINIALSKTYDHPLLAGKPASADLEGYIYGETYNFSASATVEDILTRTFDEFYAQIKENNLINEFKKHNLNLYQGITLASIIQREVSGDDDEKQVAQVFYKRLQEDKVLGSDVTFKYASSRFSLIDSPGQQSAYNTRIVKGLPPGPIAVPGLGALRAVANPAAGDYEFFLAGDDGKTYFAYTNEEHEQNIKDHCKVNCAE